MKQVFRIDVNGLYVEPVIVDDDQELESDLIDKEIPEGFYRPKWDGGNWVEGLTQEEINTIINQPIPVSPIEQLQKDQADLTFQLMVKGVI